MFQRVTRPFSKSKICRPVAKALSGAAMLASLSASILTNQATACEHCEQSCPSCACSHGYGGPRTKPLSVLQLGHLVDGLDHATDRLERTLAPRHHHLGCDAIGCDHCDAMSGQNFGQAAYENTIWNSYAPDVGGVQGSNSVLVPSARLKLTDPAIGTGVQEKIEHSAPALPVPQPFNPSAIPSLQVPTSAPQEDYRHDPFGDDAKGTSKPRNRYTENSKFKSMPTTQSRGPETAAKATPAPYTREHGLAHLVAQQQKAAQAAAQSNAPAKSKTAPQANVELATASKPSQGIRVQIGSKFVAPRPVTSTPIQAIYETPVNSADLVQPATALRLSN